MCQPSDERVTFPIELEPVLATTGPSPEDVQLTEEERTALDKVDETIFLGTPSEQRQAAIRAWCKQNARIKEVTRDLARASSLIAHLRIKLWEAQDKLRSYPGRQNELIEAASNMGELLKELDDPNVRFGCGDSKHIKGTTEEGQDALKQLEKAVDAMDE